MKLMILISLGLSALAVAAGVALERPRASSALVRQQPVTASVKLQPTAEPNDQRPVPTETPLAEPVAVSRVLTPTASSLTISEKCGGRCHDPRQVLAEPYEDPEMAETVVDSMSKRATFKLSMDERAALVQALSRR